MRKWRVWEREDGSSFLDWVNKKSPKPEDATKLVREFLSANWMTAEQEAFGIPLPKIDAGIRDLVALLNQIPGLMTVSSCQGHRHDRHAHVGLHVDDEACLRRFLNLLKFISEKHMPFWLEISINWHHDVHQCQMEVPPGALSLTLEWTALNGFGEECPPPRKVLNAFTKRLRENAITAGLLPATPK